MQLFYQPDIEKGILSLNIEESRHCVKVLRKKEGDEITIVDGKGHFYEAIIADANPKKCLFDIQRTYQEAPKPFFIHIGIAPTKNIDRIEWFLEKSIELGIDAITFLACEHSERIKINTERLEKKAISAMKQSIKSKLPLLNPLVPFSSFIQTPATQKFIAYIDQETTGHLMHAAKKQQDYLVLIGPEGDFSKKEIAMAREEGFAPVSLGNSRLRTETAGLVACHTLNLINI